MLLTTMTNRQLHGFEWDGMGKKYGMKRRMFYRFHLVSVYDECHLWYLFEKTFKHEMVHLFSVRSLISSLPNWKHPVALIIPKVVETNCQSKSIILPDKMCCHSKIPIKNFKRIFFVFAEINLFGIEGSDQNCYRWDSKIVFRIDGFWCP